MLFFIKNSEYKQFSLFCQAFYEKFADKNRDQEHLGENI